MQTLYTIAQIRALEQLHGSAGLMERAGLAAATLAQSLCHDGLPVLVVAGPGNNGGDALVAARHLKASWHAVDVLLVGDAAKMPPDAKAALQAWQACGGEVKAEIPPGRQFGLVIDGLLGIGLSKALQGDMAAWVERINSVVAPVLALDVPSGLCADTGRVLGSAVRADHTLTFIGLKPGLFTLDGPDYAGLVHLCDLGVEVADIQPAGNLLDEMPACLPTRKRNSHKGSFGSVGVLGGDASMTGAALLAARAALLAGAGRVYAGFLADNFPSVDPGQPELMLRSAKSMLDLNHLTAVIAGPGMANSDHATAMFKRAIHIPACLLADAGALALLAEDECLKVAFVARPHPNVLTPHPGEAAALLHCSVAEVQADRFGAATRIAREFNAITVLKGCGSIIAMPDGHWFINSSGNPGLAAAGQGDVLAGIIVGLLAQGLEAEMAVPAAVYLHGAAADALVEKGVGPVGLTASEVALEARRQLNQI